MAHPAVAEAAVIAIPDEKWSERPLACVAFKPGQNADPAALAAHLLAHGFAKWQLPDRYEVIDAVPRTGADRTGSGAATSGSPLPTTLSRSQFRFPAAVACSAVMRYRSGRAHGIEAMPCRMSVFLVAKCPAIQEDVPR